jgi:hypothetical protein
MSLPVRIGQPGGCLPFSSFSQADLGSARALAGFRFNNSKRCAVISSSGAFLFGYTAHQ